MEIKKIFLEAGVRIDETLISGLKNTLEAFTAWHQMTKLEIVETDPKDLREALLLA